MKQVNAIFSADFHLREEIPICRTDNFWETQWKKVDFISELQKKYNCPVIHSGDLFHHWKPSPYLLSTTIEHIPNKFYTIYGNHDLPQHNLELAEKCGINVLIRARSINMLSGVHWGQEIKAIDTCMIQSNDYPNYTNNDLEVLSSLKRTLVWHIMTYKNELPYYGCTAMSAKAILKKYKQFDLIVTGDNHQTFVEEYNGRLLVNPGSLMRQSAAQIDFKPSVFLWYAKTNTVEQVFIPIEKNVISREHIDIKEKRNNRIDAFISGLNTDWKSNISFQANLLKFYDKNKTKKVVKELIQKFIETKKL
ncbi:MAG: metallophosphoesterase family protein [Candidatus Omnitrophica bacterium]|jgi:DNA repair exonuclease SbcCD nuclease subunit|nr:metallophosphoesterase family protein [Candidatus Omnitrophota bacterium]